MRKITSILCDVRKSQLSKQGREDRFGEVEAMFGAFDNMLSGITPTQTNHDLAEVLTSGDFTYAIQEFIDRLVVPGYQEMSFAFEPLVKADTLPNYMEVTRYQRQQGFDDLELVIEKGQARPGSWPDATKRQYRVYRWAKQLDISHETLVNDDLGWFNDTVMEMGRAARRTLEKYVSRMYTNATSIARLTGLGALYSTTGRLTTARVSTARMAFGQRTDAAGEPILADLNYIVYHRGLEDTVRTIQNSTLVPELATNATNVVRGTFTGIKDPFITGTAPNLPWYAFVSSGMSGITPFVLARMAGRPAPMVMRKRSDIESVGSILGGGGAVSPIMGDFASGNIVLKIEDVWGTYVDDTEGNLFDYRGAYYSSGTAP